MSHRIEADEWTERIAEHQAMFGNRLRKRERHLRRWAKREAVSAYRLYDAEIPEVPLYVDRYNEFYVVSWLIPREIGRASCREREEVGVAGGGGDVMVRSK